MKCKYCSGEIGLEDRYCPYCGKPNEEAVRHFSDMADYQERYASTEESVVGAAKRYGQIIPRAVAVLLLVIAAVVMAVISENTFGLPELMRRRAAQKDPDATAAALDSYISERDYISLASYMDYYDIRTYDSPFEAYSDLKWAAVYYKDIMLYAERMYLHKDREKWVKDRAPDDIRFLCQALDSFFETLQRANRNGEKAQHQESLDDMRSGVMDMLRVCFGLEGEDAEQFLALSGNRKAALLEEVVLGA